ncbi:unnamed protein product [Parnassius apollo]|uniref:(apollo) hypothetical protein n=1 Tax=Parnassius apollo TaxID=110799 RepID=A0A8S3W9T5_PARAO|nr:unnamed protein product [Parnassius apollo]
MEVIDETPELNASIDQRRIDLEESNEVTVETNETETSQKIAAVRGPDTVAINENISSQSDHNTEKRMDQTNELNTEIIVKNLDKKIYYEIEIQSTESVIEVSNTETSSVEVNKEETSVLQLSKEILAVQVNHTDSSNKDKVRFKTEILVEKNDHDINENDLNETNSDEYATNNILSELGQSIELSEALRSSDVNDHVEKAKLALQQLTQLKNSKKRIEKKVESDSIINVLVKDWDDEETSETEKSAKLLKETDFLLKFSDELKKVQIAVTA